MKEPNLRTYYNQSGNRSNSVPRYSGGGENIPAPTHSENGREKKSDHDSAAASTSSSSYVRGRSRDRSDSNNQNNSGNGNEKRRKDLNEFDDRRRYVSTILERYYSHPSNRQHSLPSTVREEILNALAPGDEEQRRKIMASAGDGPTIVDDSASEVSSAISCHRSAHGVYRQAGGGGSARATPDSSPFYDEEPEDRSSALAAGGGGGGGKSGKQKKSRFFRSSSMRSLKKWMNKLRGRGNGGNNGSASDRKKTSGSGSLSPTGDQALSNGLAAPSHDSGLETPSDTSLNHNLRSVEQRDSVDAAVTGRNRNRNLSVTTAPPPPSIVDIPTPALCGIVNHGNTCYINAVVQCLSNTDLLAEYFLSGQYWTDLRNNLRNADRYGSQGNVTLALARFFKALWFNTYTPDVSSNFKSIVERYSEQYRGNQQQDAQEFFYWLADRVHEDLNVAVKRRYKLHKSRSKNEDELAAAAMEKHLEAHNSFVSARFHGLFLSTVTCPVCRKQSMKPDPFMCISLPVSQCTKRPLFVVVVFINRQPRQVRFGLNADVTATFSEVKKCLADATDLSLDQMVLCDMSECGFQTTLVDHHEVMSLGRTKCIWAFEIPMAGRGPMVSRDEELVILIGNQLASNNGNGLRFGSPVALRVNREATYGDLFRMVVFALRPQFRTNVAVQEIPINAFRMRIVDDYHPFVFIPSDVALPLYTQAVDNALLNLTADTSSPLIPHLKLMLEWQREARERYFNPLEERIADHVSAQDLRDQEEHPEVQSLHDCLAEYTRPEACQWYCPDCRRRQDSAAKRIVFYWLPDVLVLHLKRFKQLSSGQLVKLDSTVWFPVSDLDLSDYTHQSISRNQRKQQQQQQRSAQSYRTQNGELYVDTRPSQNLYDLYAVCNHSGHSPHSGHYTAFCRNPVNGRWYCFDDQNVTAVRERDLVTNGAYLLFYERRQLRKGSDGHNSAESGFVDHWFFRIYSNQSTDRERRSSYSSKDTLDGVDSNGGTTSGAAGSQRKASSSDANQHQQSNSVSTPPARATSQNKLYVQLPAGYESRNGVVVDNNGKNGNKNNNGRKLLENGPTTTNISNNENGTTIPVDFPSFVSVLTLGFAAPESFEETSPISNEESTTVTAESSSLDADGLEKRKDNNNSSRAIIGRVSSAPYDDRNGPPSHELFGRTAPSVQRYVTTNVAVKLNEKSSTKTNEEIKEERAASSTSSGGKSGFRRDSTSDVLAHRYRTCSVVETDL